MTKAELQTVLERIDQELMGSVGRLPTTPRWPWLVLLGTVCAAAVVFAAGTYLLS